METLLAIITIIQRAGGKRLMLLLFSRFIVLLGLVMTTAIMVAAILIGGLMHAHLALLNAELSSPQALLIIGAVALCMVATLIALIVWQLKGMHRLPKKSPLTDSVDAFINGLMSEP